MSKYSPVSKQCPSPLSVERLKYKQLQKRLHIQEQLSKEIGQVYDDLLREHQQILKSHEDLKEEVKALKADRSLLQAANLENQRLHQLVEDLENEKSAVETCRNSLEKANNNLEKELDGLYKELADITTRASTSEEREANLKEELKTAKEKIKELSRVVQSQEVLQHQYNALEDELMRTKKMVDRTEADAKTQYEDLRRDHEEVMKTIRESQQAALIQLKATVEEKDRRITELIAERDEALKQATVSSGVSEEEMTKLKEQFEKEAASLRTNLADKSRENQQLKNDMDSHMHNYMRVSEDYKECKRALVGKDDLIDDLRRENATLSQELSKLNAQFTHEMKKRINIEARADEYKDQLNKQLVKQRAVTHYETTAADYHFNTDLQKLDDAALVGERLIGRTKSIHEPKPISSIITRPVSTSTPLKKPQRKYALSRVATVSGGSSGMTWLSYPNENYDPESQHKIDKIRSLNKKMQPHMRSSFNSITGTFDESIKGTPPKGGNAPVTVPANSWMRYESRNYPETILDKDINCNKTFQNEEGNRLWVTVTNGRMDRFTIHDDRSIGADWKNINMNKDVKSYYALGDMTLDISSNASSVATPNTRWNAFQAVMVSVADQTDCPFSNIPIVFDNSETFIPISSQLFIIKSGSTSLLPGRNCSWSFTVPDGNDLKIVIRYANYYPGETLSIQADGGKIVNITSNVVYPVRQVFQGKNFIITHRRVYRMISEYGFYAVISAVPKSAKNLQKDKNSSHYDPVNGYRNFDSFRDSFAVSEGTNKRVLIEALDVEAGCDEFRITSVRDNSTAILEENSIVRVDSRTPEFSLDWTSDGNNRQAGFIYNTSDLVCYQNLLRNIIVPCDGSTVTDGFPQGYCTGQEATMNFIMEPNCTYFNFHVSFTTKLIPEIGDFIKLHNENEILYTTNGSTFQLTNIFNTMGNSTLTVEFNSGIPTNPIQVTQEGHWSISLYSFNPFAPIMVTLDFNLPIYHFTLSDLRKGQRLIVSSPVYMEFFVVGNIDKRLDGYKLYEGSATTYVSTLSSNTTFSKKTLLSPAFYMSKTDKLTIERTYEAESVDDIVLYFRATDPVPYCTVLTISKEQGNAAYIPQVFQPTDNYALLQAQAHDSACLMTVVTFKSFPRQLTLLKSKTNASASDPVLIFAGDRGMPKNLTYLTLDQSNSDNFNYNFTLPGTVFSFRIPAHQQFAVFYKNAQGVQINEVKTFGLVGESMVLASPLFGTEGKSNEAWFTNVSLPPSQFAAEFEITIQYRSLSSQGSLLLSLESGKTIDLGSIQVGGKFNVSADSLGLKFNDPNGGNYLIQVNLKSWKDNPNYFTSTPNPNSSSFIKMDFRISIFILMLLKFLKN